jgi:predicted nucleic acid-binding protein
MTVIVDTGVLYAEHDTDATRHEDAVAALDAVYDGTLGQPYISDYIYDEAVTLTQARGGSSAAARRLGQRLRGDGSFPQLYEMVRVSAAVFEEAVQLFEKYTDQELSFTDATTIAVCDRHDIDGILSFDDDFDGIVGRYEPSELE